MMKYQMRAYQLKCEKGLSHRIFLKWIIVIQGLEETSDGVFFVLYLIYYEDIKGEGLW